MSRSLIVILALMLLGSGLSPSALAAEKEIPATELLEEVAEKPAELPPATEIITEVSDEGKVPAPPAKAAEVETPAESEKEPTFDAMHRGISTGVLATSRWLDSFFADPRVESEETKTRVKIRFSLFAEEGEDFDYDVRAGVRLDLPILKERLQLLIAGDPEDDEDFRAITGSEGVPAELADDDENFSIALRYFLKRTVKQNISLRSGVRFRSGLPHLYLEPRYRQSAPMGDWLFRFTQRIIGITDGTVRAKTIFDFERKLRQNFFLRLTAEGTWDKDEHGYFYTLSPSIFQPLSSRRVLVYTWSNSFVTHPNHRLEDVTLSVRYRQRIWRDWLYYEVIPQLSFPREENFDVTPGIMLRLEAVFGHYRRMPPEPG